MNSQIFLIKDAQFQYLCNGKQSIVTVTEITAHTDAKATITDIHFTNSITPGHTYCLEATAFYNQLVSVNAIPVRLLDRS